MNWGHLIESESSKVTSGQDKMKVMEITERMDGHGLFEDPDFPSDDSSLFSDLSTPLAGIQGEVTWRRPQELCDHPVLLPANIREGHAKQGLLGDCWFLCACTFLLNNKHLMNKVCPPEQPWWGDALYRGSVHFHIWQKGQWTRVAVDDRLPCVGSTLCFSRCHSPTAFWVALLEKAYAKLHGSYESLWAGQVSEALVDLSGGLAECWSLQRGGAEEEQHAPGADSDRVRRRRLDLSLLHPVRELCALSCSTHSRPGGDADPEQYHAMSVTGWLDVETVSGASLRLLRVRNPWGRRGSVMEGEACWGSVDPGLAQELQGGLEPGEFWVDEAQFLSRFDDVTVGYPVTEDGFLRSIFTGSVLTHSQQLTGAWTPGLTAGGCRNCTGYASNPKFWLRVSERGEVLVSLHQQKTSRGNTARCPRPPPEGGQHQHYSAIALHMWKVEKKRVNVARLLNQAPTASTQCHAYHREVVLHAQLEPGHYLLVPSTFRAGSQGSFLIRAFSPHPVLLSAMRGPAGSPPRPPGGDSEWDNADLQGSWEAGLTAGGSRNSPSHWTNPRFLLSMEGDAAPGVGAGAGANVRVSLRQHRPDADLHAIGFHIYKVPEGASVMTLPRDQEPVASCVPHCYTQDVSLACCLPAGSYAIMPSTYQPGRPAAFTLSVARRIHRRVVKSQELLGNTIQEVSHVSVMRS